MSIAAWMVVALLPLLRLIACFLRREIIKDDDAAHVTLDKKIDTVAQAVGAIARDVSFLAGRQMERDRAISPAGMSSASGAG